MMIVPRAYSVKTANLSSSSTLSEKIDIPRRASKSNNAHRSRSSLSVSSSPTRSTSLPTKDLRSSPVKIPSRNDKPKSEQSSRPDPVPIQPMPTSRKQDTRVTRETAQSLLSATSIPMRRRPRGRPSQRLPNGDYVADFSRLLMDDVKTGADRSLSRSASNSHLDALFGNIDGLMEGQMFVGSEGVDDSVLTIRSASSDSLASLASPDDYGSSGLMSPPSSIGRSFQEKPSRQKVPSEECIGYHPLSLIEDKEEAFEPTISLSPPSRPTPASQRRSSKSLKSTLTASLKAIKSAAQSVSKTGLLAASRSDDYSAKSFFDIQPSMTDDKRPPPSSSLPSPELRRYLNPQTTSMPPDSPVQLHFWHDDRQVFTPKLSEKAKAKIKRKTPRNRGQASSSHEDLPPVVALATCLPPSVRTANASSPPIWLRPDGTPSNKHTANSLLLDPQASNESVNAMTRQREPRENSDFLRIFVCEMQMRRNGKLNDDLNTGRARLWLPPLDNGSSKARSSAMGDLVAPLDEGSKRRMFIERWRGESVDEI